MPIRSDIDRLHTAIARLPRASFVALVALTVADIAFVVLLLMRTDSVATRVASIVDLTILILFWSSHLAFRRGATQQQLAVGPSPHPLLSPAIIAIAIVLVGWPVGERTPPPLRLDAIKSNVIPSYRRAYHPNPKIEAPR